MKHRYIIQAYGGSPKKKGSLEEYFLLLSKELYDEGYQSVFIFNKEIEDTLKEYYTNSHARIIVIPNTEKRFDIEMIRRFRCIYKELRPALVNFHFGMACINGLIAAHLEGIKNTVWTKHSFYEKGPFYKSVSQFRIFTSMIFLQGLLARKMIAVSDGLKKELLLYHIPESKITQIYLGINIERFSTSEYLSSSLLDLGVRPGGRVISCISQARPEKGLEYLIRAISLVVEKHPEIRLMLVGGGPLTEELRSLTKKMGIGEHVYFLGVRNDVEIILSCSDFTVLPSLTEGLPLALLESMAAGKPVIASNVGGIPEVVSDGQEGFLVPPKDVTVLAERIIRLLSDRKLLNDMGKASALKAKRFDLNNGVKDTVELYRKIIHVNV